MVCRDRGWFYFYLISTFLRFFLSFICRYFLVWALLLLYLLFLFKRSTCKCGFRKFNYYYKMQTWTGDAIFYTVASFFAQVVVILADMCSLRSVKEAVQQFLHSHNRLDILVNNAGIATAPVSIYFMKQFLKFLFQFIINCSSSTFSIVLKSPNYYDYQYAIVSVSNSTRNTSMVDIVALILAFNLFINLFISNFDVLASDRIFDRRWCRQIVAN